MHLKFSDVVQTFRSAPHGRPEGLHYGGAAIDARCAMFFRKLRCSFCRRTEAEVAKLVAGPHVYICDRCAREALRIMDTAQSPAGDD